MSWSDLKILLSVLVQRGVPRSNSFVECFYHTWEYSDTDFPHLTDCLTDYVLIMTDSRSRVKFYTILSLVLLVKIAAP